MKKKNLFLVLIIAIGIISGTVMISFFFRPSADLSNNQPQIIDRNPSTNKIISEGESQVFRITALDADDDVLSFIWTINDTSAGENVNNFTFLSNFDSAGSYLIKAEVSDGKATTSTSWILVVLNVNRNPYITDPQPAIDPSIAEGESQVFNIMANDPDNDPLTCQWTVDDSPVGTNSTTYTHDTGFDDKGTYQIKVNITDGELSDEYSWTLYVGDVNRAPFITDFQPSTNPTINEGESQEFNISASDLDNDALTYQWTVDDSPVGTNSTTYTHDTGFEDEGTYQLKINVTDGELFDTYTWTLTVIDLNTAPVIDSFYPLLDPIINETQVQKFNVSASDPEFNPLTYTWKLNEQVVGGNSTEFYYFTTFLSAGNNDLSVTIDDGKAELSHTWKVTVNNNVSLLKDINPSGDSNPSSFTFVGNLMFFTANDGTHGYELWVTNGTPSGTYMVKDIRAGVDSSSCQYLTPMNGILYFSAYENTYGRELWRSDGTYAGTYMVKNINPSSSSIPSYLTVMNNILYFQADDKGVWDPFPSGTEAELWRSDGTSGGTYRVTNIYPIYGSSPRGFCVIGNTLYFEATDLSHGPSLYKTNGASYNTVFIKEIDIDTDWGVHRLGTKIIFKEWANPTYGDELWVSDGTLAGTLRLKDIYLGASDPDPKIAKIIGAIMYFTAYNSTHGRELWKTDGTPEGTTMIKDIYNGTASGCDTNLESAVLNNVLYFEGNSLTYGHELWRTNGTAIGTHMVKDIYIGSGGDISYLVASDSYLYFNGYNSTSGHELWKSNGTEAGTTIVADSNPGSANSNPRYITIAGDKIYYCAYSNGGDIWISNGTEAGTHYLAPLKFPDFIKRWGSTVFVLTNEFACGNELYIC